MSFFKFKALTRGEERNDDRQALKLIITHLMRHMKFERDFCYI